MDDRTTKLDELRKGARFSYGDIIELWDVGPYTIAKYYDKYSDDKIMYHAWVDGVGTNRSESSLEYMLAHAMAVKHEGPNAQAALYFVRMIGIDA